MRCRWHVEDEVRALAFAFDTDGCSPLRGSPLVPLALEYQRSPAASVLGRVLVYELATNALTRTYELPVR
jgi:hypothetical protein